MKTMYFRNYLPHLFYVAIIILAFQLRITLPEYGDSDPSWIQALCYATKQHLVWGKDIIFTYGPWHMVATRAYDPQFYPILLFSQVYVWLAFGWFLWPYSKNILLYFFLALFACLHFMTDVTFFAIGFLFFLAGLSHTLRDRVSLCLFLMLSGFITLAKMSYLPMYLGLMLLTDFYQIYKHRNFPLFTICLSVSFILCWILSGQQLQDLPVFLQSIKPIISAYSESMQITKSAGIFYIASIINTALILKLLQNLMKSGHFGDYNKLIQSKIGCLVIFIAVIFYQYLAIKSASTRLDGGHSSIAFAASLFMLMFLCVKQYGISSIKTIHINLLKKNTFGTAILLIVIMNFILILRVANPDPLFFSTRFLLAPNLLNEKYDNTRKKLSEIARTKLGNLKSEDIKGAVDSYPWDITEMLVLGLKYSPRPTLQTYSSYDAELQMKDLAHLQGANAPQSLFFRAEDIDGRFPTTTIGPSLLEILQNYRFKTNTGIGLFLERRKFPLVKKLVSENEITAKDIFQEPITLPNTDAKSIRMISINLDLTLLGHLLKTFSKTPEIHMDVLTDAGIYSSRLIPPAAKTGFMISPLLDDKDKAQELFNNIDKENTLSNTQIRTIKLRIKSKFKWAYKEDAVIKWQDFKLERASKNPSLKTKGAAVQIFNNGN